MRYTPDSQFQQLVQEEISSQDPSKL